MDDSRYLVEGKYGIEDLIDIRALAHVFESFSSATGFTVGFLAYPSQKILIKTGWRDACVKFHRACPESARYCLESNVALADHLRENEKLCIRPCGMGLVDGAIPVLVRGVYIAYLATGQVFFAPPDLALYQQYAGKFGYDTDEYLEAIRQVPVVSEQRFREALLFLSEIAGLIAELGLRNLERKELAVKLEGIITERQQSEDHLKRSNRAYQALTSCVEAVAAATDENSLFQETVKILQQHCGYQLAWIGLAENDEAKTVHG